MKDFKPMLASPAELDKLNYPLFASPKLDGIRATVVGGQLLSRKKLKIPNKHIFSELSKDLYDGLDGELVVGEPTAPDVYNKTNSAVMSHAGYPAATFYVFDVWDMPSVFSNRLAWLKSELQYEADHALERRHACELMGVGHVNIVVHQHTHIGSYQDLLAYEEQCLNQGYEGLILRSGMGKYKFGRSTAREQYMLKLKRFQDSEALVLGIVEEMHNTNEATMDHLGHTKRSKAKAGMVGKGTMGALMVRDVHTGVEFEIGSGFTAEHRKRTDWVGKVVKYKFFPIGIKDKPRHPIYLGERNPIDM